MTHNPPELSHSPFMFRRAGVLLHPTSLPGVGTSGTLGSEAYRFIDFLAEAGQKVWQVLPLGPTHEDLSPYQPLSALAGNPDLISTAQLGDWGLLESHQEASSREQRQRLLRTAAEQLLHQPEGSPLNTAWLRFGQAQRLWLDDYARFRILKRHHGESAWFDWPAPLRDRDEVALAELDREAAEELALIRAEQFFFYRQWMDLKRYANERGVALFGDMPIFVAHDSADVWSARELFDLDDDGHPTVVAGVPPDYFSATGQRWGNPLYDWTAMEKDGFGWWRDRMALLLKRYDLMRIDHFRGFEAYWEIPASEETAINGRWVKAPGEALFKVLQQSFDPLPIIAEDLGIITDEVLALRDGFALPGMKILQFAFSGTADNPYLSHNHEVNSVVFTGTHDNDTTLGWYRSLDDGVRGYIAEYMGSPAEAVPWSMIRAAYASVARLAMVPMQDLLELGSEARMNTPGTTEGNWRWRFDWEQIPATLTGRLHHLASLYQR